MNLDSFQSCFFQDDEEIDALATGLATSILSQARAAGVVRNKVGCLCLDMVTFYLDWFVF